MHGNWIVDESSNAGKSSVYNFVICKWSSAWVKYRNNSEMTTECKSLPSIKAS